MVEEGLVARAQVVEAWLPVRGVDEPVLGAAAVAGEAHVALQAEAGKRVSLVEAEPALPLRADQLEQVLRKLRRPDGRLIVYPATLVEELRK